MIDLFKPNFFKTGSFSNNFLISGVLLDPGSGSTSTGHILLGATISCNVGIGTTSPDTALDIEVDTTSADSAVYPNITVQNPSTATASYAGVFIKSGNNQVHHYTSLTEANINLSSGFPLDIHHSGTSRLYVKGDGNVGIGETSPSEKLEVLGNAKVSGTVQALGGTSATNIAFGGGNNTGMYFPSQHVVRFSNNGSASVTINATGQVGIGATSPNRILEVVHGTDPQLRLSKDDDEFYDFKAVGGASGHDHWFR